MTERERISRKGTAEITRAPGTAKMDPYSLLAQGVVMQAIYDWRDLIVKSKIRDSGTTSFDEIERFLGSRWCANLLCETEIDPGYLLLRLKEEREDQRIARRRAFVSRRPKSANRNA